MIRKLKKFFKPSPPLLKQQLQSEQSIGTQKTPSLSSSIAATVGQNGSEICMQKKSTDLVYDEKLWVQKSKTQKIRCDNLEPNGFIQLMKPLKSSTN